MPVRKGAHPGMGGKSVKSYGVPFLLDVTSVFAILDTSMDKLMSDTFRGGQVAHPLGNMARYRWHRDTDSYFIRTLDDIPTARLFRRDGEWRLTFEIPECAGKDIPLFATERLNDPVYTTLALLYAIDRTAIADFRADAIRRIIQED